jgi:C-terminal processing protease CtpA/Prc
VKEQARGAKTVVDTYPAIRSALIELGDYHSRFITPDELKWIQTNTAYQKPTGQLLKGRIGYIQLPGFSGSEQAAAGYATAVQRAIQELDAESPCGWIVDLYTDHGGDMWPMLAGIGPVLGEGVAGYFVFPGGDNNVTSVRDNGTHLV